MTILNRNNYSKINTSFERIGSEFWTPPVHQIMYDGNILLDCIRTDFKDTEYWFIEIYNGNAFQSYPIETIVPVDVLRKIWKRKTFLIISNGHETYHDVVTGIYRDLIVRANIPIEQIILISESADIIEEVKIVSKNYNLDQIKVEWVRAFEYNAKTQFNVSLNEKITPTLENKHYNKKFLSFNRHMMTHGRLHRGSLISLLCAMNMLDYGYISAGMFYDYPTWADILEELKKYHNDNSEILSLLNDNEQKILNIEKLTVDADYLTLQIRNNADLLPSTTEFYSNSYFSVVTETNCFARGKYPNELFYPGRLLSEKTFKTIVQKHPFVIVAPANTLSLLKEIGYKTFSPWINENYDTETNESMRMLMIVKEIKRLCELSPEQLTDFLNNVREICEHNFNILLNKTEWITKLN